MTEHERDARRLRALVARLRQYWQETESVHRTLSRAVERIDADGADPDIVSAVALYLQNVYTALEQIFERIALDVDGVVPAGDEWHRDLLEQMSLDIDGVRPGWLPRSLQRQLDVLRRFRHRVRHAYADEYDWNRMEDTIAAEETVIGELPAALESFERFLQETIAALEAASVQRGDT